jgi:hypothetical protein
MQELIEKLMNTHGLTHEQSHGVLNTIKEFIVEKFPMAAGMLNNFFPAEGQGTASTPTGDTGSTEGPEPKGGSFLDNISEMIPGEIGEKAEQFIKDKLGNITGNK